MLIAGNRRNRDQHNETGHQGAGAGLGRPSRFHIIMAGLVVRAARRGAARTGGPAARPSTDG